MEFENLGSHCSFNACGQKDFLPFECSGCQTKFCRYHFRPENHECKGEHNQKKQIDCPFCSKTISYFPSQQSAEKALEEHENSVLCGDRQEKSFCSSCKVRIYELNKFECQDCGKKICLKCRMPEHHKCQEEQQRKIKEACEKIRKEKESKEQEEKERESIKQRERDWLNQQNEAQNQLFKESMQLQMEERRRVVEQQQSHQNERLANDSNSTMLESSNT